MAAAVQARLSEGVVRCYMAGDRCAGFGFQKVKALVDATARSVLCEFIRETVPSRKFVDDFANGAARLSGRAGCDASSDEVCPAVAASTDTAATAAGSGRTDTLRHERFPSITFSVETMLESGPLSQAAAAKYRFCLCSAKAKGPRNIVLVATVDRSESHARNSLPELRASIAQPAGVLSGAF